jgi:hypothetical protein
LIDFEEKYTKNKEIENKIICNSKFNEKISTLGK